MTATRKHAADYLETAERELLEWAGQNKSHWDAVHGAVTGDYAAQYERAARADAAEIDKLTKAVIALRLLASGVTA